MRNRLKASWTLLGPAAFLLLGSAAALAQSDPRTSGPDDRPGAQGPAPRGPMAQERQLVKRFDADKNNRLDAAERAEAREFIKADNAARPRGAGGRGPGSRGGFGRQDDTPAQPGSKVSPSEVAAYPDAPLFDTTVLRTFFLDFESPDWEAELADFYNSDVEVPAMLTVDGVRYPNVGIHFRGASSFFMVPAGRKRSLNVSMDFADPKQLLYGHRTLNLLNSHGDPSFMSSVLFSDLARPHVPAPRANFVKLVINGESWGVYVSVEQFNADFIKTHYDTAKGARWKVNGSPNAASGLDYIGDEPEDYKARYEMKNGGRKDWADLIRLCRTLSTTPLDELEAALGPMLDVDGTLWFLALDNALVNSDGYWVRASDYSLYKDPKGVFHIIPHDMNEAFSGSAGGPGFGRGPRGPGPGGPPAGTGRVEQGPRPDGPPDQAGPPPGPRGGPRRPGYELDPMIGMDDPAKPLRSRLLAVPSLRAKYLANVRAIAESLDWSTLGPVVARYRALIEDEVRADTRKSFSFEAFDRATSADAVPPSPAGARSAQNLRTFTEQRRKFLLDHAALKAAARPAGPSGENGR